MEIDQNLLQKVKTSIRRTHNKLDEDLSDTIAACLADLQVCGVHIPEANDQQEMDPLILNAVKLYCKEATTDDPVKAARFKQGYDALKSCLMMAGEYKGEAANG